MSTCLTAAIIKSHYWIQKTDILFDAVWIVSGYSIGGRVDSISILKIKLQTSRHTISFFTDRHTISFHEQPKICINSTSSRVFSFTSRCTVFTECSNKSHLFIVSPFSTIKTRKEKNVECVPKDNAKRTSFKNVCKCPRNDA